jgi:translation initiation factor IF-1
MSKDDSIEFEGTVSETLQNTNFRVRLLYVEVILGKLCG